jgi:hypothetical protein
VAGFDSSVTIPGLPRHFARIASARAWSQIRSARRYSSFGSRSNFSSNHLPPYSPPLPAKVPWTSL